MKILLSLTCNFTDHSGASVATLEIDQATARHLIELHSEVRSFVGRLANETGLNSWLVPSFGWSGVAPIAYSHECAGIEEMARALGEKDFVVLKNGRTFAAEKDDDGHFRTECNRVQFDELTVSFTALAKHGSEEYATGKIPIAVLKKLAA